MLTYLIYHQKYLWEYLPNGNCKHHLHNTFKIILHRSREFFNENHLSRDLLYLQKDLNLNLQIFSCKKQAKSIGNHFYLLQALISWHPISYSCLTVCTDERLNGPVVGRWSIRAGTLLMYQSLTQGAGGAGV